MTTNTVSVHPRTIAPSAAPKSQRAANAFAPAQRGQILEVSPPAPMLSKHNFLRQLRLEKRRTERSKAPLSLVLFNVDLESAEGTNQLRALADSLRSSKRETDVLGYVAEDCLGFLLPDTSQDGAHSFTRNVRTRNGTLDFSTVVATYPDQVFESLTEGSHGHVDNAPLFLDHEHTQSRLGRILKRTLDIFGSAALLLLLSPVMIAAALAVRMTSPGPAIFKQQRLGRFGIPFDIYKFRSMSNKNDDKAHREYVAKLIAGQTAEINNGDAKNPVYKMVRDPRITRVGHFIRKTSIDELPQLFNVFLGDMSLVGPRPPLRYEAEKYQVWHLRRILEVRPGITGLWQVIGRSTTNFDEMVRLDLKYIREWSIWMDIKLLFGTLRVVIMRSGGA
jgi:lipopolysaccharide/colanic/teichoic acid biosynthesis glycosyltransferase